MGVIFSCFSTCFMLLGEGTSILFLALGEIGSMLSRGIFGLLVGICDVLAACMCCWRVPFEDRPDRDGYTFSTLVVTRGNPILNNEKSDRIESMASEARLSTTEKDKIANSHDLVGSEDSMIAKPVSRGEEKVEKKKARQSFFARRAKSSGP